MTLVVEIVVWLMLGVGSIFAVIGGIGLIRLPDFYTRIHAVGVTDTLGAGLILFGCAVYSVLTLGSVLVAIKLFTVWVFIYLTGPAATHALAKAAYARGLKVDESNPKEPRDVVPV